MGQGGVGGEVDAEVDHLFVQALLQQFFLCLLPEAADLHKLIAVQAAGDLHRLLQTGTVLRFHRRLELPEAAFAAHGKCLRDGGSGCGSILRDGLAGHLLQHRDGFQHILLGRGGKITDKFLAVARQIAGFTAGLHVSGTLQQIFRIGVQINITGLDQLLRYMIGAQVVCGKFLYTVTGYPLVAVEVLRDVQGKFQGTAVFILQSGGKLVQPVRFALTLLSQNIAEIIPIPNQIGNAGILLRKVSGLGENTPGFQQSAVLQRLDQQLVQCQHDLVRVLRHFAVISRQTEPHALGDRGGGQLQLDAPIAVLRQKRVLFGVSWFCCPFRIFHIIASDEQSGVLILKLLPDVIKIHIGQDVLRQAGGSFLAVLAQILIAPSRMERAVGQAQNTLDGVSRLFGWIPHRDGGEGVALPDA